jgi:hypothetical protein
LAQRSSRKRRKQRKRTATQEGRSASNGTAAREESGQDRMARGYARGRAKDEAARAALKPLGQDERPLAVTIAAIIAFALGAANFISYLAGVEVQGEQPSLVGIAVYSGLMLVVAYGCFRMRYWGVLGMEAVLALALVIFGVLLTRAESIVALLIALAVIAGAGTLFWKLVKVMARIQMPERPGQDR